MDDPTQPLDTEPRDYTNERRVAEAALFMAPEPLTLNDITKILGVDSPGITLKVLDELEKEFNSRESALEITSPSKNHYQMRVRDSYAERVSHLAVTTDMSKAVLRTLGLIAVRQPVRQSIVVRIVGNKAYDYIGELAEKGFIKADKQANTKLLSTTSKFDSYFGKSAAELLKEQPAI